MPDESTTKFRVDISELKKGMQEAARQVRLANSEFKAATSGMDDWGKSADGISAKIKQLDSVLKSQNSQLKNLEKQYELVAKEEGATSKGAQELLIKINNQKAAINKTNAEIKKWESALEEVTDTSKDGEKALQQLEERFDEVNKEAKEAGDGFTVFKGVVADLVASGIKNLISGIAGLAESTMEYRTNMGKLNTAFETNGHSTEAAKNAYEELNSVLGDNDKSTEAANHLAKLTDNEKDLATWTGNILPGVFATFGDSLPIEGLTEAANETAKVGKVTGPLADALNWAGISEDKFNESLEKCNSEQERQKLIMDTLNKTYGEASEHYKETNADVIAANKAQSELTEKYAILGEKATPIVTAIKQGMADLLGAAISLVDGADFSAVTTAVEDGFAYLIDPVLPTIKGGFQWILDNKDAVIAGIVGIGVGFATWKVVGLIQGITAALKGMTAAQVLAAAKQKLLNIVMAANPVGIVIAAITALVAAFIYLWNTSDEFRAFWINLWEKVKSAAKKAWTAIVKFFSDAWKKITEIWGKAKKYFSDIWENIKKTFSNVKTWFGKIFSDAWNSIKSAWSSVKTWFSNLWSGIKSIFSNVSGWFGDIFGKAWTAIKNKFAGWGDFWSGLWSKIKNKFSDIGSNIGSAISSSIKSGLNRVLSTIESTINKAIGLINSAISLANKLPGVNVGKVPKVSLPRLWQGGVLKRGQVGLLEGNGDEAVVPLHNNKKWISKTAQDLRKSLQNEGVIGKGKGSTGNTNTYNFYQTNNSPKALSRLEIYRQTRNQLNFAKGV